MSGRLLKVEGAGNDFLLGTGRWAERLAADADLVRRLCRRQQGVGADGALALFRTGRSEVRVDYCNADGTRAAFCANGTRCAARGAVELLGLPSKLVVHTGWGPIPARVAGMQVGLELPSTDEPPRPLLLATGGRRWHLWWWRVGVPHLVVPVEEELAELDLARWAPPLRHHPELAPEGANVNFVAASAPGHLAIRSWERGVEGETLSCGSGVVAAALVWMAEHGGRSLTCATRSGDLLEVEAVGELPVGGARLSGPARFVAAVEPAAELLD